MANLQKYKTSKKDRSCKSKKTSTKILASYSSVSTILHFPPAFISLGFNSSTWLFFSHEGGKKMSSGLFPENGIWQFNNFINEILSKVVGSCMIRNHLLLGE